jgi:hypothetical protein
MASRNPKPPINAMPAMDVRSHYILAPNARLSAGQRLVALCLLLWDSESERLSIDPLHLSQRCSLSVEQVSRTLDALAEIQLARQWADGWRLSFDDWRESVLRPTV